MNQKLFEWVDQKQLSIAAMINALDKGQHFAFSRCGDGEFDAILKEPGANCDGHKYYPELGEWLEKTLNAWKYANFENYYMGIHYGARNGEQTVDWLYKNRFKKSRHFCDNSVFHNAFVDRKLESLFDILATKQVVVVGPQILQEQTRIPVEHYIEVDEKDSWHDRGRVQDELNAMNLDGKIVLFCSGPPTPVFIHDQIINGNVVDHDQPMRLSLPLKTTLIDFGCSFDPYAGRETRSFHKKVQL
jgi:hypothetical protein